jgi:hypothetical protein
MTRLRKLAVRISNTVVCRSLPAYRDWAQATARELEFIESDWAALRWALGSWKMAASCQNAPLTSISEVPRAARNFLLETRVSTVANRCSLLIMAASFSFFAAHTTRQASLLAWCLVIAAVTYLVCDIVHWGWRFSSGGGLPEVAAAYRSALVRQQDRLSGAWYSSLMALSSAATAVGAYNVWLTKPSTSREIILPFTLAVCGFMGVILLAAKPVTRRLIAKYQRRIDELDALESDGR